MIVVALTSECQTRFKDKIRRMRIRILVLKLVNANMKKSGKI